MSSAIRRPEAEKIARPQPLRRVLDLHPYVQGKIDVPGTVEPVKLSSNECCFGPSPLAVEAYFNCANELHRYADGSQSALREAIARSHRLNPDMIVCGNGSEELIGLLTRAFVGDGDELLLSENHFVMCSIYGVAQGANIVLAPEKEFRVDVDALLERVSERTKMIAIANPNNPTGTYVNAAEMQRLLDGVPPHVLVLLDGAYAEYVTEADFDPGIDAVESSTNVVMTRTFSKIYGLAGLRIGWAYGPAEIVGVVNRLRTPFNASLPAMAAATAALRDVRHVEHVRAHNRKAMGRLRTALDEIGLRVVPSVANFYLIDFSEHATKSAVAAATFLEERGIIPRPAGKDNLLRITVGTDDENDAVISALCDYLEA